MGATERGVFALARKAEIELEPGGKLPWLSSRGHLDPVLQDSVAQDAIGLMRAMYLRLGGDEGVLAGKRSGSSPRPDFLIRSRALIVEVDEIQHFTSDRLQTLELYPQAAQLAFDIAEYRTLIERWSSVADGYRATKPAVDFRYSGGRRAQRAYFDAVRDLAAPAFGWKVLRIPAPECHAPTAASRLIDRLASRS